MGWQIEDIPGDEPEENIAHAAVAATYEASSKMGGTSNLTYPTGNVWHVFRALWNAYQEAEGDSSEEGLFEELMNQIDSRWEDKGPNDEEWEPMDAGEGPDPSYQPEEWEMPSDFLDRLEEQAGCDEE